MRFAIVGGLLVFLTPPVVANDVVQRGGVIGSIVVDGVKVEARSNGYLPTGAADHAGPYQCVGLARNVIEVIGGALPALGSETGAAVIWERSAVWPNFVRCENAGSFKPEPYDLVVYDDGEFGHVAVVKAVGIAQVQLIEQNWSATNGEVVLPLTIEAGSYHLPDRKGRNGTYFCRGWVRFIGNPWRPYDDGADLGVGNGPAQQTIWWVMPALTLRLRYTGSPNCKAYFRRVHETGWSRLTSIPVVVRTQGPIVIKVRFPKQGGKSKILAEIRQKSLTKLRDRSL